MKTAELYRKETHEHICPFGIKSKDLLERQGYKVEDHKLTSAEEAEAFMQAHDVKTTPQTFIDGERVGGYDDLVSHFNVSTLKQEGTTYQPIIAIFGTTFLMALSAVFLTETGFSLIRVFELFIAFSMCVLGVMKLRDLYNFSNQFITYDLLGRRFPRYAYVYPFVETGAGILMISGLLTVIAAPATLFISVIGAISVIKAVYIDQRELKCACVGGDSNVPLGVISLSENLLMALMAIWMFGKL